MVNAKFPQRQTYGFERVDDAGEPSFAATSSSIENLRQMK
jgi:hypothetical protein